MSGTDAVEPAFCGLLLPLAVKKLRVGVCFNDI